MTSLISRIWNDLDTTTRASRIEALRRKLDARLSEAAHLITDESNRRIYARDLADLPRTLEHTLFRTTPLIIVQPREANDIAQTLRFANEERIAVFPRSAASSAFGGPVPTTNGIVIDLSPLQKIESPDLNAKTITLEAGARFGDVADELARYNLALFTYPSNRFATVGGWIAGGGCGINGLKYGHISEHITALQVVTPQGKIETIRSTDAEFYNYFGTEGLMGIVTRVTLRVREQAAVAKPHFLSFDSDTSAFAFIQELDTRGIRCCSVEFYDAHMIQLLNEHRRAETSSVPAAREMYLVEQRALLFFNDDVETETQFNQLVADLHISEAPSYIAGTMWADRFFPMKIRALGPALLAAETVLPLDQTATFLARTRELAKRFGIELATECHIVTTPEGVRVLAMPMFLTDIRKINYSIHLMFVSLLDRVATRFGGKPYNLGIWHAPFARERWGETRLAELRAFKRAQDPRDILNPGKFFHVRSRFAGVPGVLFHPTIFKLGMDFLTLVSHLAAPFNKPTKTARALTDRRDITRPQLEFGVPATYDLAALVRTAVECTSCGACISVCPAYVHTKDERVTGRAKMWLARKLAKGETIAPTEAEAAWLCVRCRACAEVCQTQLPLMAAYEKLEMELSARLGRPDQLIEEFVTGMERDPGYRAKVGLTLPVDLLEQRWRNTVDSQALTVEPSNHPTTQPAHDPTIKPLAGGKYHIATHLAPPQQTLLGKFAIERDVQCISCGHCGEACIYGVHFRNPNDLRRMNSPQDVLCRGCFRCIQECPRNALTISFDADYAHNGRGAFTADVISSLQRQADEGMIPVLGAGYRGPFSGAALDSMWTDMSEIVRPTRDGIHGREYISTVVDLGRRPERVEIGEWKTEFPKFLEVPLPILFNDLPIHRTRNVLLAAVRAAQQLGTYAIVSRRDWFDDLQLYTHSIALSVQDNELDSFCAQFPIVETDDSLPLPRIQRVAPDARVMRRVNPSDLDRIVQLARGEAEILHVLFDPVNQIQLFEQMPRIHARLVAEGLRDAVTIIASGAIAMAEDVPKTILLGADAVAVDLPLLAALECGLDDRCFTEDKCTRGVENIDPAWGAQRIVNLTAAWRNQLLEVMGAMGMREVRRLRGERGRALLKSELDKKLFEPIFAEVRDG